LSGAPTTLVPIDPQSCASSAPKPSCCFLGQHEVELSPVTQASSNLSEASFSSLSSLGRPFVHFGASSGRCGPRDERGQHHRPCTAATLSIVILLCFHFVVKLGSCEAPSEDGVGQAQPCNSGAASGSRQFTGYYIGFASRLVSHNGLRSAECPGTTSACSLPVPASSYKAQLLYLIVPPAHFVRAYEVHAKMKK
jgi:hypothetical protein